MTRRARKNEPGPFRPRTPARSTVEKLSVPLNRNLIELTWADEPMWISGAWAWRLPARRVEQRMKRASPIPRAGTGSPPQLQEDPHLAPTSLQVDQHVAERGVLHLELHGILLSTGGTIRGGCGHDRLAETEIERWRDILSGDHRLAALAVLQDLHDVDSQVLSRLAGHAAQRRAYRERCAGVQDPLLIRLEGRIGAGRSAGGEIRHDVGLPHDRSGVEPDVQAAGIRLHRRDDHHWCRASGLRSPVLRVQPEAGLLHWPIQ